MDRVMSPTSSRKRVPPLALSMMPDAGLGGMGEGALHVAEELAFQDGIRQGGAVLGHEGLVLAGAGEVEGAGHQLLAGAGFARDEHGALRGQQGLQLGLEALHGLGEADEILEGAGGGDGLGLELDVLAFQGLVARLELGVEAAVLLDQAVHLHRLADHHLELDGFPGLVEEVEDLALVDGRHHRVEIGEAGDEDAHRVRMVFADPGEQLRSALAGHALVGEDAGDAVIGEELAGLGGAGGAQAMVFVLQGADDAAHDGGLVVDDEEGGFHGVHVLSCRSWPLRTLGGLRGDGSGRLSAVIRGNLIRNSAPCPCSERASMLPWWAGMIS